MTTDLRTAIITFDRSAVADQITEAAQLRKRVIVTGSLRVGPPDLGPVDEVSSVPLRRRGIRVDREVPVGEEELFAVGQFPGVQYICEGFVVGQLDHVEVAHHEIALQ